MTNDKPLDDRRKAQEEEYFRKQSAEAASKLRAKAELEGLGIQDRSLIDNLMGAGFDADSSRALYLLPLVDAAWADGRVQTEEKKKILEILDAQKIDESSKAYTLMMKWLERGEADESFVQARKLLEPLVTELKKSNQDLSAWILEAAEKVAKVTNSFFGLGPRQISKEEQAYLEDLAKKLKS